MVVLNTLAIVVSILVGICFVVSCIYGAVYSWVQIIADSPKGYKVLLALLYILFVVLAIQFTFGLTVVFGY